MVSIRGDNNVEVPLELTSSEIMQSKSVRIKPDLVKPRYSKRIVARSREMKKEADLKCLAF